MGKVQVLSGDCVQVMRALRDSSVDAVVTDPPYALNFMGKSWDSFAGYVERNGSSRALGDDGGRHDEGYRNMKGHESEFQAWCEIWAAECLRVLKPGGHLLAFGGTRTYHRLACGIEDAGFEIRDSLHWLYGSGFPKSLDVSKAIDKAAGVEREVVGPGARHTSQAFRWGPGATDEDNGGGFNSGGVPVVTAPATEDAARWEGWGTALKPAHEPIVLARKPLALKTVAANVLGYGTGALNIDGIRVPTVDRWEATGIRSAAGSSLAGSADGSLNVSVSSTHEGGRWPANILLTHSADCQPAGTRQVKTGTAYEPAAGRDMERKIYGKTQNLGRTVGYGTEGQETVEAWVCAAGCPVAELDTQSGKLTSGAWDGTRNKSKTTDTYGAFEGKPEKPRTGDSGAASRFFPAFRYQAKAPSRERPKDNVTHPTVKPLELMRWLVRLVTPPAGIVLDPFAGSGTTGEACVEEGFRCILIEREPDYMRLIRKRLDSREPVLWDDAA